MTGGWRAVAVLVFTAEAELVPELAEAAPGTAAGEATRAVFTPDCETGW